VGAPHGIVAGQAWESESEIDLRAYHRAKTGALFEAAVGAGALAGGGTPADWALLGTTFGEAYQVADDIADVQSKPDFLGKETGQDAANGRPNVALELGVEGAAERLVTLLRTAMGSLPPCAQRREIQRWIAGSIDHFLPEELAAPSRAALLDAAASGL
jgi:geranylgeranyl diphosphate synthase type II